MPEATYVRHVPDCKCEVIQRMRPERSRQRSKETRSPWRWSAMPPPGVGTLVRDPRCTEVIQFLWTTGKWSCSTNEEVWNGHDEHDTEEQAIAYGHSELAPDQGLEDGQVFYTGQIRGITADELADAGANAEGTIEAMEMWLYDTVGEAAEDAIRCSLADQEDLELAIRGAIRDWFQRRQTAPNVCLIDHVKSHLWQQCREVDESQGGPSSTARCMRAVEHEGECEFP